MTTQVKKQTYNQLNFEITVIGEKSLIIQTRCIRRYIDFTMCFFLRRIHIEIYTDLNMVLYKLTWSFTQSRPSY